MKHILLHYAIAWIAYSLVSVCEAFWRDPCPPATNNRHRRMSEKSRKLPIHYLIRFVATFTQWNSTTTHIHLATHWQQQTHKKWKRFTQMATPNRKQTAASYMNACACVCISYVNVLNELRDAYAKNYYLIIYFFSFSKFLTLRSAIFLSFALPLACTFTLNNWNWFHSSFVSHCHGRFFFFSPVFGQCIVTNVALLLDANVGLYWMCSHKIHLFAFKDTTVNMYICKS